MSHHNNTTYSDKAPVFDCPKCGAMLWGDDPCELCTLVAHSFETVDAALAAVPTEGDTL